ncbi:hypothetical protein DB771_21905 [Burkholderia sp. AU29985]|nr:hypothetical protein XM57_28625 [Burkholderia cepacia]ETP63812.1 hypothetical protein BDSB_22915 [Burkholderia dolosa PC543]PRE54171.1 hypothetical protein C6P87_06615 [Burkholderia sp. AU12872]PUA74951.1 hypothetical protein DB771_21905 [Burkholderia sp. AU29985]
MRRAVSMRGAARLLPRAAHRAAAAAGVAGPASACTAHANALQSNHAGGVAAAPINLSLKRK